MSPPGTTVYAPREIPEAQRERPIGFDIEVEVDYVEGFMHLVVKMLTENPLWLLGFRGA